MQKTVTPEQMRSIERKAIDEMGIGLTLMEQAAQGLLGAIRRLVNAREGEVLFLCGPGNNGADGVAAARQYARGGGEARVWLLEGTQSPDLQTQLRWLAQAAPWVPCTAPETVIPPGTSLVVDALFGTGLSRPLSGEAGRLVFLANQWREQTGSPVLAADIPSGLNGETGEALGGLAIFASETVTFHRPKQGLYLRNGLDHVGEVTVRDIQLPDDYGGEGYWVQEADDVLLPARRRCTHKGDYGRLLCVCGSMGMAGAAAMCASSSMEAGAGLVTVACPEAIVPIVQTLCPQATCLPLAQDADDSCSALLHALEKADCVAVGCGLSQSAYAGELLAVLADRVTARQIPSVWDADALNWLACTANPPRFSECQVLTPHPAEAARLLGCQIKRVLENPLQSAHELAQRYGASVVLKGAASVLLSGGRGAINVLGSASMAQGGSGDKLTGTIAALLAGRKTYGLSVLQCMQEAHRLRAKASGL